MALTIATGFVVDDAIVMIENIARHREMGKPPMQAALQGAGQIGFTIVSLTISLVAVLIPLLFMQEVIGRLFREFAVTLAITILISAVVSLTLTPMMCARWLEPLQEGAGRLGRAVQRALHATVAAYGRALQAVLARQTLTLLAALGTVALTALLYVVIPKGLFPTQSSGQLMGRVQAASDASFARMALLQQAAARVALADQAVQSVSAVAGVDGANNTALSEGRLTINLRPRTLFGDSEAAIMQRLRQAVAAQVPGATLYLQPTQDLTVDSATGPTEYRFDLEGADTALVNEWAQRLAQALQTVPEVRHATTSAGAQGLAAQVQQHRQRALQRLWPAHRLHHLHGNQPVPRHPRRGAPARLRPVCFRRVCFRPVCFRRGRRRQLAGAARAACQNQQRRQRAPGQHRRHHRSARRPANHPRGPVPGGHRRL